MFLNEAGGVIDDLIVGKLGDDLLLVVNAAGTEADLAHLRAALPDIEIELESGRALLSLQGPGAAGALAELAPEAVALPFMGIAATAIADHPARISRSGYTGEDGFEISVAGDVAVTVAEALLARPGVVPAGLGARDTLRLEAGLCLYGQDLDTLTTPVEAGLAWTLGGRRLAEGGFPGHVVIHDQLAHGPARQRVGLVLEGRALARALTDLAAPDRSFAGTITSGGFSPTLGMPIAMAYVRRDLATAGTKLDLSIRGQRHQAMVVALPLVPHRYPIRGSHG
jgi:aminomethyltransferase